MGDLSKAAQCVRVLLIVINILFFILGVVVFALGIYLAVDGGDLNFITGNQVIGGAALFIIVGAVAMVITIVCIFGAIFKWRPILVLYAVIVTVIVILQIVAAILGFVFSDNVAGFVDDRIFEAIRDYRLDTDSEEFQPDVNQAVDFVQDNFDCCGYNNASDWFTYNLEFLVNNGGRPPSTCDSLDCDDTAEGCTNWAFNNATFNLSFNATSEGCRGDTESFLRVLGYTLGGVGIAFGIIEILGVLFALFFCCCISQTRKQTVV